MGVLTTLLLLASTSQSETIRNQNSSKMFWSQIETIGDFKSLAQVLFPTGSDNKFILQTVDSQNQDTPLKVDVGSISTVIQLENKSATLTNTKYRNQYLINGYLWTYKNQKDFQSLTRDLEKFDLSHGTSSLFWRPLDFFRIEKAHGAAGLLGIIYSVMGVLVSEKCAYDAFEDMGHQIQKAGFKDNAKAAGICGAAGIAWPFALWYSPRLRSFNGAVQRVEITCPIDNDGPLIITRISTSGAKARTLVTFKNGKPRDITISKKEASAEKFDDLVTWFTKNLVVANKVAQKVGEDLHTPEQGQKYANSEIRPILKVCKENPKAVDAFQSIINRKIEIQKSAVDAKP